MKKILCLVGIHTKKYISEIRMYYGFMINTELGDHWRCKFCGENLGWTPTRKRNEYWQDKWSRYFKSKEVKL